MAAGFFNSTENRSNQVTFFYRYFLGREADATGLAFHVAAQGCQQSRVGGDMNCDTLKDGGDIGPWILAAINPSGYQSAFPNCNILNGDFNNDSVVNGADVAGMVNCMLTGNCP